MHLTAATLLALQCALSLAIRVPVTWNNNNSEVNDNKQFTAETIEPQNVATNIPKSIPKEYFEYTAQKPKFAVDIAKFHGVQSPDNYYKAYPVKPYTGVAKPELGKHQMLDKDKNIFRPYQEYVQKNEAIRYVTPSTTSYDVFHPYKLEEPALKELYRDPVMDKIRNDLLNSKNKFQKYENEAAELDVTKGEYLESPEETDRKKFPYKNVPVPYEIHRPQRRPIYYRPPSIHNHRDHVLNQKFRHPWHQNHVKVKPLHYRPVKNHLQRLRQQHALKYDDEHNEYPQLPHPEKHSEPLDGYDIYQKGKEKFVQLRNNVDESINEAVQNNRPLVSQKLEINDETSDEDTNAEVEEDEFVPIKNYAQVRRTETTKHLPKEAAFQDADTLDEIKNAPRLREAIKSTKAQTVYSEEGYEDSAYDHAGEQKHASDHEGHGGFLKEKELSGGKYKTPTFNAKFKDGNGSEYRDQITDSKKWKDDKKDEEEETESEESSEKNKEISEGTDVYSHKPKTNKNDGAENIKNHNSQEEDSDGKREERLEKSSVDNYEHDVNKREVKIVVPEIDLNTTYLTENEILTLSALKLQPKTNDIAEKYPYYFKKLDTISKHSPLRYSENLKLIPKKSEGGTEFYDSRSKYECPEVDDDVDPIPEKLKKDGDPDEGEEDDEAANANKSKSDFSVLEEKPRLSGLGDKIDCFKAKYFGINPLDSPFFKEEIISKPEPVTVPSMEIYKLKKDKFSRESKLNEALDLSDTFTFSDEKYPKQDKKLINIDNNVGKTIRIIPNSKSADVRQFLQSSKNILYTPVNLKNLQNINNTVALHKNNTADTPITIRKKRAAPFIYEPYKIIKDSQNQDSKKTTTTNNISPLIKQLQSSRVVERVTNNQGKDQVVKRNVGTRTYKDIGKNDRERNIGKGSKPILDASFVDVSVDQRRGEPRYELRSDNHKKEYAPVENKTSMTKEEYNSHTGSSVNSDDYDLIDNKQLAIQKYKVTTPRSYISVPKYLPLVEESKKRELLSTETEKEIEPQSRMSKSLEKNNSEEEYDEYDDDLDYDITTSITTIIPPRTKIVSTPTTVKTKRRRIENVTEVPKLRLVTRFRNSYQPEQPKAPKDAEKSVTKINYDVDENTAPKYREKKKKSSKSTIVTDTKTYGQDNDDDLKREEVDALIGVRQDIKEYMPRYEKETHKKHSSRKNNSDSQEDDDDDDDDNNDDDDHDDDDDDDDDDGNYEEDDHVHEDDDDDEEDENEKNDDDNEQSEEEEDEEVESKVDSKKVITTPEPIRRTLGKTTEAPLTTTEVRSAKLELKPMVLRKKIEIHKELPVNRSSPHISEFKQDIKEVEIIKEIPSKLRKKPQKNIEALELYKDENLAKDVNKLGGVEIFKEELDIENGPKHGGNYRSAEITTSEFTTPSSSPKGDVIASQSKTSKLIEVNDDPYSKRRRDIERARNSRGRSAKFIELSESTARTTSRPMHGGNLRSIHDERRKSGSRNAKIIELDDQNSREEDSTNTHNGDFKSYRSRGGDRQHMHGGNYRSAKIVQAKNNNDKTSLQSENVNRKAKNTDGRRNAAALLSSFVSAVPVLTTTPAYILDPSKRMYYYVDA